MFCGGARFTIIAMSCCFGPSGRRARVLRLRLFGGGGFDGADLAERDLDQTPGRFGDIFEALLLLFS